MNILISNNLNSLYKLRSYDQSKLIYQKLYKQNGKNWPIIFNADYYGD